MHNLNKKTVGPHFRNRPFVADPFRTSQVLLPAAHRHSGISRIRFIHASNQIPCSSNVCCIVAGCLAILRIQEFLNSTLEQYSWNLLGSQTGGWDKRCFRRRATNPLHFAGTPSPPTKSLDFRGFDSNKLLILKGGNSHVRMILLGVSRKFRLEDS